MYSIQIVNALDQWVDRESPGTQELQCLGLTVNVEPFHISDGVGPEVEGAARRYFRIQLTQGAGRGIARIGEEGCALLGPPLIETLEAFRAHVDLAARLQSNGDRFGAKAFWYVTDCAEIGGHILAFDAVTASGTNREYALFVGEGNRQAVDLGL